MKKTMIAVIAIMCVVMVKAQTDYTSLINNPSFEKDTDGWEHKGMNVQSNNVFSIKSGSKYMERWTGKGGAVGSCKLSQTLTNLPPGNYELTAAAQNIQEDTPTAAQTGAWIFAEDAEPSSLLPQPSTFNIHSQTLVTVRDTYTVSFTNIHGTVTIGFEAVNASGNWIALDNFKLTQVDTDLSVPLSETITAAETLYGDGNGLEAAQLKSAIDAARIVAANTTATAQEQADAIVAMEEAAGLYQRANATAESPLDMTDRIVNPSFETGDLTGWTTSRMGTMNNDFFKAMKGTWYVEAWTWAGNTIGDARLSQTLTGMPAGRYRLTAGAQNYQENASQTAQTGAWIFAGSSSKAVTFAADYTVEFVQVTDAFEIGFNAKGATGNWLSVDNFRLEYIGENFDEVKTEFENMIARAQALLRKRMNSEVKQALADAVDAALTVQGTAERADATYTAAATALEAAYNTAATSQALFARLANAIAEANEEVEGVESAAASDYRNAIADAQTVYDTAATTDAQVETAIEKLSKATFAFRVNNATGQGPTVTTDSRFIRGCTWAFGRSTVKGSNILEEGFCWSTNPDPKVTDNRTTEYINQAGKIYWLRNLKPATVYYMRAYAINKNYAVGYGDVIKVVTIPKGAVGHWYNNGGDEATNDRINYAINTAMDYYWNNLSSIHGFGISVTYSPGTPTADCSYGGSMRVGSSSSYQQPGTIMHEALHGIGVGTHGNWWSADYRPNGVWAGDRVTEALHFWDNNTTTVLAGDDMHMWPYGCNGAHEDTHNDNLYCMMGILAQALNEDGLPASGEIGYALPYYAFNQENGVKYYIKNEDESHGLRSAYLVETTSHTLQWKTMTTEEAAADDHAAWYISFTPSNQYYQLRNAATGYYMNYDSGIKTTNVSGSLPASADFHLMRGRVDVDGYRGYYIIHPESSANPPCLNATSAGKTGTTSWNIANSAKTQRWLIFTIEQAKNFETGNIQLSHQELDDWLTLIRKLAQTPHSENVEGADATLNGTLSDIETQATTCTNSKEIDALITQARQAALAFLTSVRATDEAKPFDLTFMIVNPDFDNDVTTGWSSNNGNPGYGFQAAEFFQKTFNYYQDIKNMPAGRYELHANAFQRPGAWNAVYTPYANGTAKVNTFLYITTSSYAVKHICDDRQSSALQSGDKQLSDGTYIPNNMEGATKYFASGLYDSSVSYTLEKTGGLFRIGIRCNSSSDAYWTMFDNFRLYFFGADVTGIDEVRSMMDDVRGSYYNLSGQRVDNPSKGLYIINGRKVVIK